MRAKPLAMILLLLLVAAPFAQIAYAVTGADQGDEVGQNDSVNDIVYEEIKAAAETRRAPVPPRIGAPIRNHGKTRGSAVRYGRGRGDGGL